MWVTYYLSILSRFWARKNQQVKEGGRASILHRATQTKSGTERPTDGTTEQVRFNPVLKQVTKKQWRFKDTLVSSYVKSPVPNGTHICFCETPLPLFPNV